MRKKKEKNISYDPQYDPNRLDKFFRGYQRAVNATYSGLEKEFPSLKNEIREIREKALDSFNERYPGASELCRRYVVGDSAQRAIVESYRKVIDETIKAMAADATRGKKIINSVSKGGKSRKGCNNAIWDDIRERAKDIKKRNPHLSKTAIAKLIRKSLEKDSIHRAVSTIRQRIK